MNKILGCFVLLLMWKDVLWAQSCVHRFEVQVPLSEPILQVVSKLSVCSDADYKNDAMVEYQKLFLQGEHSESTWIFGSLHTIQATPKEYATLKKLLSMQDIRKYSSGCSSVRCVLAKAYHSDERGMRALIIQQKFGYTVSNIPDPADTGATWTRGSIRLIQQALELLPDIQHSAYFLKGFKFVPQGYSLNGNLNVLGWTGMPGNNSSAAKSEYVYLTAELYNRNNSLLNIIHEIAHQIDAAGINQFNMNRGEKTGFYNLANWQETEKFSYDKNGNPTVQKIFTPQGGCFISNYSKTNPREFFAESFAYYVAQAHNLKAKCPRVYNHLKHNFFAGKEFLDLNSQGCSKAAELQLEPTSDYFAEPSPTSNITYELETEPQDENYTDVSEDGRMIQGKDGQEYWIPNSCTVQYDENGGIFCIDSVSGDQVEDPVSSLRSQPQNTQYLEMRNPTDVNAILLDENGKILEGVDIDAIPTAQTY